MAKNYAGTVAAGTVTAAACFLGVAHTAASPTTRPRIFEFEFGSSITPADYASRLNLARITSLPTGGTVTQAGNTLDPADGASEAKWYAANTGGGTAGTSLLVVGVNMRATFRWVAAPGKEIVIPATQNNGACIFVPSQSTAYTPDASIFWEE
jgi:hypothetical protein